MQVWGKMKGKKKAKGIGKKKREKEITNITQAMTPLLKIDVVDPDVMTT